MLAATQSHQPTAVLKYNAALSCFFNALIRETSSWRYEPEHELGPVFVFILSQGGCLLLPCVYFAEGGRHGLSGPCYSRGPAGQLRELAFAEAAALAMTVPELAAGNADAMLARVLDSERNMAGVFQRRACEFERLFKGKLNFIDAESALLTGHSVHPCPKARDNFSEADALAYAPEYRAAFPLLWVAVRREDVMNFSATAYSHEAILAELAQQDQRLCDWLESLSGEQTLIPCHPYQWPYWQGQPALAARINSGSMTLLGYSEICWQATSSLRALYCEKTAWMPKFSLSVKLTNSLRHLQPEELARGGELVDVLATSFGQEFQNRFPQLQVLAEPVAVCLCNERGEALPETAMLWRENPLQGARAENTEVLATLLQDDPRDGESRLVKRLRAEGELTSAGIQRWFAQYLDIVLKPLLLAQADYGILFGAHQQNIVVGLEKGLWPERLYFRDCQGTGFTALAHRQLAGVLSPRQLAKLPLVNEAMAEVLFTYYLFINASFNVISSLAMPGVVAQASLFSQLRAYLEGLRAQGVADGAVIEHLLSSRELQIKANFHCAMTGLNENTQSDILGLYRPITNPLIATGS